MLTIYGRPQQTCQGWSRREVLQAGGAGLFGTSLSPVLNAESSPGGRAGRAK